MTGATINYQNAKKEHKKRLTELREELEPLIFDTSTGHEPTIRDYLCVIFLQNQTMLTILQKLSNHKIKEFPDLSDFDRDDLATSEDLNSKTTFPKNSQISQKAEGDE